MTAVDSDRYRVVRIARAAEKKRVVTRSEDEEPRELVAELLGGKRGRGQREERKNQDEAAHGRSCGSGEGWFGAAATLYALARSATRHAPHSSGRSRGSPRRSDGTRRLRPRAPRSRAAGPSACSGAGGRAR